METTGSGIEGEERRRKGGKEEQRRETKRGEKGMMVEKGKGK